MEFWRRKHIIYVQYTNPGGYPPLEHSSQILAEDHWQILFLGCTSLGSTDLLLNPHNNICVRKLKFVAASWRQRIHYIWFMVWVVGWTLRWRPSWIYASDPLACPVALFLSYLVGLKILYHEHDSPNENSLSQSLFMQIVMFARKRLGSRIQIAILPNPERAARFKQHIAQGVSVITVWNCPSVNEVVQTKKYSANPSLRLLYHGSIVPSRLPLTVIQAMSQLPEEIYLRIIGYETIGYQGYVKKFLTYAQSVGLGQRVEYLGGVPHREELLSMGSECDIGLALMPLKSSDWNEQTMYCASNKPFDYLASGLGLVVSDLPQWRQLFVDPAYGLACDPGDPESVANVLRWFIQYPDKRRNMGEFGRQRIRDEWNYEKQFAPVLAKLNAPK